MDLIKLTDETRKADTPVPARTTGDKRDSRDLIDENIRRVYEDLLEDDVPDRFKKLLDQLREQDKRKARSE